MSFIRDFRYLLILVYISLISLSICLACLDDVEDTRVPPPVEEYSYDGGSYTPPNPNETGSGSSYGYGGSGSGSGSSSGSGTGNNKKADHQHNEYDMIEDQGI